MKMRPSRILARIRAGHVARCAKLNIADPRAVEIVGAAGFDAVWTCMEHVPNTLHDVENQIRAAKIFDMDTIVRVPRGSYSDLLRPLEMDAAAIMVPHVMGAADARQVARQTKFHPVGRRPLDGGGADAGYCALPVPDYIRQANEQRLTIVQIEDPEPMAELDEIAAIEGIDMLFFGPGDFSHGLGVPGQVDDPRIDTARRQVADAARRHGKLAGTVGSVDTFARLVELGYRLINLADDVRGLGQFFTGVMAAIDDIERRGR